MSWDLLRRSEVDGVAVDDAPGRTDTQLDRQTIVAGETAHAVGRPLMTKLAPLAGGVVFVSGRA